MVEDRLIEHTIPDVKNHPDQKFKISKQGCLFLKMLNDASETDFDTQVNEWKKIKKNMDVAQKAKS